MQIFQGLSLGEKSYIEPTSNFRTLEKKKSQTRFRLIAIYNQ